MTIVDLVHTYWLASSVITFVALLLVPSKTNAFDNGAVCVLLALAAGWLMWPVCVVAAYKVRRHS